MAAGMTATLDLQKPLAHDLQGQLVQTVIIFKMTFRNFWPITYKGSLCKRFLFLK
jgi:hypothetical protein